MIAEAGYEHWRRWLKRRSEEEGESESRRASAATDASSLSTLCSTCLARQSWATADGVARDGSEEAGYEDWRRWLKRRSEEEGESESRRASAATDASSLSTLCSTCLARQSWATADGVARDGSEDPDCVQLAYACVKRERSDVQRALSGSPLR